MSSDNHVVPLAAKPSPPHTAQAGSPRCAIVVAWEGSRPTSRRVGRHRAPLCALSPPRSPWPRATCMPPNLLVRHLSWPCTPPASFPTTHVGHLRTSRWAPRLLPGHRTCERRPSFSEVEGRRGRSWRRRGRLVAATTPATASARAAGLPVVVDLLPGRGRPPPCMPPTTTPATTSPGAAGLPVAPSAFPSHRRPPSRTLPVSSVWIHRLGRQIRPRGGRISPHRRRSWLTTTTTWSPPSVLAAPRAIALARGGKEPCRRRPCASPALPGGRSGRGEAVGKRRSGWRRRSPGRRPCRPGAERHEGLSCGFGIQQ
ncbi:hypothetical protein DAI22_09g124850 [Oryza sativa Japonica Group]|nr:hypothetical protein DAI22_09g124850 [Oryza sativa Japonica Group]